MFSVVFGFKNPTQEIFSELDGTKTRSHNFAVTTQKSERESKTGSRVATPYLGAAWPWPVPKVGVGPLGDHRPRLSAYLISASGKP